MAQQPLKRFRLANGVIYDGGVKISEGELASYLQRQQKAMDNNRRMGQMGQMANELLMPEFNEALSIYRTIRPDLFSQQKPAPSPGLEGLIQK